MADQNLKQIQFKRTSTENKAPGADIVARGEIALNTHGRTLAIYTKDENDAVVQLAGKGVPFLDTSRTLSVDGTTTLKRLYLDQGKKCVRLKPENKNMKDIVTANCSIQGIAVKIMKDLV